MNNTLSINSEHLTSSKDTIVTYINTQFENIIIPSSEKSNIEHDIPHIYILRFLEIVFEVANPIALGVYMQIFGGLRIGEVVNIRTSDIKLIGPYGQDGLLLNVKIVLIELILKMDQDQVMSKTKRSINPWL